VVHYSWEAPVTSTKVPDFCSRIPDLEITDKSGSHSEYEPVQGVPSGMRANRRKLGVPETCLDKIQGVCLHVLSHCLGRMRARQPEQEARAASGFRFHP